MGGAGAGDRAAAAGGQGGGGAREGGPGFRRFITLQILAIDGQAVGVVQAKVPDEGDANDSGDYDGGRTGGY